MAVKGSPSLYNIHEASLTMNVAPKSHTITSDDGGLERVVGNLKREQGYSVVNLDPRGTPPTELRDKQAIADWISQNLSEGWHGSGVPDLFCYNLNAIEETHFCEVKSVGDGLRENQMQWIEENAKVDVRLAYAKRTKSSGQRVKCDCGAAATVAAIEKCGGKCPGCGEELYAVIESEPENNSSNNGIYLYRPKRLEEIKSGVIMNSSLQKCFSCELPSENVEMRTIGGNEFPLCNACHRKISKYSPESEIVV